MRPAKGFKVARQRFLHWLVDWCFRADVVSSRNESLNFLLGEWNLRRNLLRRNPSEWSFSFFLVFTCSLAERTDQICLKTFFFFGDHHEINPKTLVWEVEDKLRLNFGPSNFCNSKFGPRLKKKLDVPGLHCLGYIFKNLSKEGVEPYTPGASTFFSRGPNLLLQKFDGPKFSLSLSSTSQTKVLMLISWWSPKKKKRSSLRFDRFFLPRSRWRPKKKEKGHSDGFLLRRFHSPNKKFKDSFLQLTTTARKHQSTNQCRNLWRATLKPLAGHLWPAGRVLDAPDVVFISCTIIELYTLLSSQNREFT